MTDLPPLDVLIDLTFEHSGERVVRGYCREHRIKNGKECIEFEWLETDAEARRTRFYMREDLRDWTKVRSHHKLGG